MLSEPKTVKGHSPSKGGYPPFEVTIQFEPGDRVRHVKHPELVGTVKGYEWAWEGQMAALPYKVYWDEGMRAVDLLGFMHIYPSPAVLEPEGGAA